MLQLRTLLSAACLAMLSSGATQAALVDLDNQTLGNITGQAGISIRADVQAQIGQVSWIDDGGSLSLRNVRIDNGCVNAGDCPNGSGGFFAYGPAQLGLSLSLPAFGVHINVPTLKVDVITGSNGQQQLQFTLPDLTGINEQLMAGGIPAQRIRVRVAGDMYVGDSRLGSLVIRDITSLRGNIRVWGH
ncbi:DUF6160 family protein [Zestomonas carbonaria]|uniref:DUF6160 family protein n=1 Tax=Zestomonas carbonaria TaxID=2762745 RepID=UPI0038B67E11